MNIIYPLFLPSVFGFLFLLWILQASRLPQKIFLCIALAPATGLAIVSTILFIAYAAGGAQAKSLCHWLVIFACAALLIYHVKALNRQKSGGQKPSLLIERIQADLKLRSRDSLIKVILFLTALVCFLFILVHFFWYYWGYRSWNAFGGWDARYFWMLKARFLFRSPEEWRLMFSPLLDWANIDYPLMWPGMNAWGWNWLGKEALGWPIMVAWVLMLSACALVIWYLAAYVSWFTALLAGSFFITIQDYRFWCGTLYADVPYAFFCTASVLFLVSAHRLSERRLFLLSGLFAGFGAWTKNEGVLLIGCLCVIVITQFLIRLKQNKRPLKFDSLFFLIGIIPGVLIFGYFKYFLSGPATYLIQKHGIADVVQALTNWQKWKFILAAYWTFINEYSHWNGLWWLFMAALVAYPFIGKLRKNFSGLWIVPLSVMLIELGYMVVFTLTPKDIRFHLQTALVRLLLHTGILAVVFAFEVFGFNMNALFAKKDS